MIKVVNIIPQSLSGEARQDAEPNIAVNPANPAEIAITAFTPDPLGGSNAPIFVSTDGGNSWVLNTIVPSQDATTGTGDITPRFADSGRFYAGILRRPGNLRLNILRSTNFSAPTAMSVLVDRTQVDQPYTQAATVPSGTNAGKDRLYIGLNDFAATGGRTATVETSLDAAAASPTFSSARIEKRGTGTAGQNGPQIRPAVHQDGTVYAIFYGWRAFSSASLVTSDVVVVRDDNWGSGSSPFTALKDPGDNLAGRLVATGVQFTWNGSLAQERLGGDLAIAVAPSNSSTVYIAFCDVQSGSYTIHVRRSTDRGQTWSADLKTIGNAKNPSLAIAPSGRVGLAYQRVTGSGSTRRWDTHLELTTDAFATSQDNVLATTPATTPAATFLPYLGDYIHMMASGERFLGVFSANNTPDPANFPQGVTYLRNHDFATKKLFAVNGTTEVSPSIDPFFFVYNPLQITALTRLTRFTSFTRFTPFTLLTSLTRLTALTRLTRLTSFTRFTPLTHLTRLTQFTRFTPFTLFTRLPPLTPFPGAPSAAPEIQPFIRFGNSVFAPEELELGRFEALAGALDELAAAGITRLHQLATADPFTLSGQLGWTREDAARLVELGQQLLRSLAQ
jgi:hypothetical protein